MLNLAENEGGASRLSRTWLTEGEVLQRLQHLEHGQEKLERGQEKLDGKIDANQRAVLAKIDANQTALDAKIDKINDRANTQLWATVITLVAALVGLVVSLLEGGMHH